MAILRLAHGITAPRLAVRAREAASDVAQSVCREILERLDHFQYGGEAGFKHWLYATAMRRLQKKDAFHRAQKRDVAREKPRDADGGHGASLLAVYNSISSPSQHAMGREELVRIEGAVRVALHRALVRLAALLDESRG